MEINEEYLLFLKDVFLVLDATILTNTKEQNKKTLNETYAFHYAKIYNRFINTEDVLEQDNCYVAFDFISSQHRKLENKIEKNSEDVVQMRLQMSNDFGCGWKTGCCRNCPIAFITGSCFTNPDLTKSVLKEVEKR